MSLVIGGLYSEDLTTMAAASSMSLSNMLPQYVAYFEDSLLQLALREST